MATAPDAQAWLDNPTSNDGWLVLGDESTAQTARRFGSRENADPTLRPVLTVDYTPIPEPDAVALALAAVAGVVVLTPSAKSFAR